MEHVSFIPEEEQRKIFADMIERELHEYDYGVELSPFVKSAFMKVDRRNFIPPHYHDKRFENTTITIYDNESSISQPSLVAQMLQLAAFSGEEKALEIGTASGVNAAYMSHLAHEVHTIEYDECLAERAKENLLKEGRNNVTVHTGDGLLGLPEVGPFDRIIVTAGARDLPTTLVNQLAPGGKMVIPIGKVPFSQYLYTFTNSPKGLEEDFHGLVSFVPLVSNNKGGWSRGLINELKAIQEQYSRLAQSEEIREGV